MKRKTIAELGYAVVAVLLAGNVHAQVTMSLPHVANGGGYFAAENSSSFISTLNNNQIIAADDLIGIYQFKVTVSTPYSSPSSPYAGNPLPGTGVFYATCLSPLGSLPWTTPLTYDSLNFFQANNGRNPSGWAGGNLEWGIQNADYLYGKLAPNIITAANSNPGSEGDAGAAMALAMYTVLYNSTDYGDNYDSALLKTSGGAFQITGTLSTAVLDDYNTDLGDLTSESTSLYAPGYVLRPQLSTAQDMILIGGTPQGNIVPEPTTIISGALLLLPFGASTMRILRKNRAA